MGLSLSIKYKHNLIDYPTKMPVERKKNPNKGLTEALEGAENKSLGKPLRELEN